MGEKNADANTNFVYLSDSFHSFVTDTNNTFQKSSQCYSLLQHLDMKRRYLLLCHVLKFYVTTAWLLGGICFDRIKSHLTKPPLQMMEEVRSLSSLFMENVFTCYKTFPRNL